MSLGSNESIGLRQGQGYLPDETKPAGLGGGWRNDWRKSGSSAERELIGMDCGLWRRG